MRRRPARPLPGRVAGGRARLVRGCCWFGLTVVFGLAVVGGAAASAGSLVAGNAAALDRVAFAIDGVEFESRRRCENVAAEPRRPARANAVSAAAAMDVGNGDRFDPARTGRWAAPILPGSTAATPIGSMPSPPIIGGRAIWTRGSTAGGRSANSPKQWRSTGSACCTAARHARPSYSAAPAARRPPASEPQQHRCRAALRRGHARQLALSKSLMGRGRSERI